MKKEQTWRINLPKRPLGADERGLVLDTLVSGRPGGTTIRDQRIPAQALRSYVLFWDRLDEPVNMVEEFERQGAKAFLSSANKGLMGRDRRYLAECGFLQQSEVFVNRLREPEIDTQRALHTYRLLEKRDGGRWSIARTSALANDLPGEVEKGRGAVVALHNAIPVPDKLVPLEDIIKFRERRKDELLRLRNHLDSLYAEISASDDKDYVLNSNVAKLTRDVNDYRKAADESGFPLVMSDLSATVNVGPADGTLIALQLNGISEISSLLTAGAVSLATLTINVGAALRQKKEQTSPYEYVVGFDREA